MATFDATLGGASANSYVTVAEADELAPLVASKVRADAWLVLTDALKEVYLMRAVRMLETYIDFDGVRLLSTQPLAWPRDWVYGLEHCTAYPTDAIPGPVADAQVLMALNLSEGFDQESAGGSPIEFLKVSSLSIRFNSDRAARGALLVPAEVVEKLRGFGEYAGASGMARSIQLVRG